MAVFLVEKFFMSEVANSGKQRVLLYHVNTEEKVTRFFNLKELCISKHRADDRYAGQGMYFWDNLGNADYWKNEKEKHLVGESIAEVKIYLIKAFVEYSNDDLMDLTDQKIEKQLFALIKKTKYKNEPLGKKIDYLCESLQCKLVKFTQYYKNTPQTGLLKDSNVSNRYKTMFCIKPDNYSIIVDSSKEDFSDGYVS